MRGDAEFAEENCGGAGDGPSETKMREDAGKFGRVQEDARRCGEMWGDLGR